MKTAATGAKGYFDQVPSQWDALYSHENRIMYLVNRFLRKALYQRYEFTFEKCDDLTGKNVLDIGCGTGRYSIECAKRGAKHVVGIDFAPSMIEFSQNMAKQMQVEDICQFVTADFVSHEFNESFDIVLALGLFDYVKEPAPILKKVAEFAPQVFVASFPKFTPIWGLQRKFRYHVVRKCPIYNYTKDQLTRLYTDADFPHVEISPSQRGFLVMAGQKS